MINRETPSGVGVPKHHDTFGCRRIVVHQCRKACRRGFTIGGGDIEGSDRIRALAGNGGAKNTITGNCVARNAIVAHGDLSVGGCGIQPIKQSKILEPVRIMHPRGDDDGLIG